MKTLIIILLFILCSCGYSAVDYRDGAIISKIENTNFPDGPGCYYYTRTIRMNRGREGYFFEKCGKFTVGDTVKVVMK